MRQKSYRRGAKTFQRKLTSRNRNRCAQLQATSAAIERAHLSDEVSVESESDVGRVTPVDDGDTRPVSGHVQSLDDPLHKVQHVVPPRGQHRVAGMKHKHEIHLSAAVCDNIVTTSAVRNHTKRQATVNSKHLCLRSRSHRESCGSLINWCIFGKSAPTLIDLSLGRLSRPSDRSINVGADLPKIHQFDWKRCTSHLTSSGLTTYA